MGDVTDRRAKRGQRANFLRGVLDSWKSVASSSSQDSPSHSTSCGQLITQSSGDDVNSTPPTSVISSIDQVPTIDDLDAATCTSLHCHSSLKLDLSSDEVKMRMTPSPAPGVGGGSVALDSPGSSASGGHALVKAGFLFSPTALSYDPVQRVFAFGNQSGYIRWMSIHNKSNEIDCHARHPNSSSVVRLQFVINEGTLISVTSDDLIHLWNWKLKTPEIVQSLKFQREHVTFCHIPFQSKWFFIGTDKGNIHIANLDSFALSGYVINWNKAIDSTNWNKAHPGSIVHISECPIDPNKLLIAFESGLIALWDLRSRSAEFRTTYHEAITCISWHHEGRSFMVSHSDGSLTTWEIKNSKPSSVQYPHARTITDDLKIEPCRPINRIDWKTCKSEDAYIIFSGGLPVASFTCPLVAPSSSSSSSSTCAPNNSNSDAQQAAQVQQHHQPNQAHPQQQQQQQQPSQTSNPATPTHSPATQSLSIIHGKTTVLEMKSAIIDFVTLCEAPYECDFNEPFAVLVLLSNDLMIVDLTGKKSESSDDLSLSDGPRYRVSCILPESEPDETGTLFVTKEMPEPPKQGFFKGLFSGGPSILDREELFGESGSGKGSKTIAKAIPGSNFDQAKAQTGSLQAELMKARQGLTERGDNLERLEDRTVRMANESEGFKEMSHQLLNKYKEKKWYQF